MKLKGHTDNVRALLLDPTGRLCLSGSSDSIIRCASFFRLSPWVLNCASPTLGFGPAALCAFVCSAYRFCVDFG
jgi:hypothetical protein